MSIEDYHNFDGEESYDWSQDREPVTLKYTRIVGNTPKAYLVDFSGNILWLPRSQVTLNTKTEEITVPAWLYTSRHLGH
jgi:hypothetical protein